jgi:transposase-like protein
MPSCRYCGSSNVIRRGKLDTGKTKYRCKDCGRWGNTGGPRNVRSARILLLDIETLPGEYYAFDPKVEYIAPIMQIKDWSIACYSAKWLFEDKVMGQTVTAQEAYDRQDSSILGGIWKLMNEADIIITQNGIKFDIKKLNTRFVLNKMMPPARFLNVDTLRTARDVFGFTYNRLDELGQKFGIGKKIEMSFRDWKNCLTNDSKATQSLKLMLEYCKNDIAPLLEDVYISMLPYITNHPNLNVYTISDQHVCPKCESTNMVWSEKPYATPQGLWESFRCQACGSTGRGTKTEHRVKSVSIR